MAHDGSRRELSCGSYSSVRVELQGWQTRSGPLQRLAARPRVHPAQLSLAARDETENAKAHLILPTRIVARQDGYEPLVRLARRAVLDSEPLKGALVRVVLVRAQAGWVHPEWSLDHPGALDGGCRCKERTANGSWGGGFGRAPARVKAAASVVWRFVRLRPCVLTLASPQHLGRTESIGRRWTLNTPPRARAPPP